LTKLNPAQELGRVQVEANGSPNQCVVSPGSGRAMATSVSLSGLSMPIYLRHSSSLNYFRVLLQLTVLL
jgi:hypothetical protein